MELNEETKKEGETKKQDRNYKVVYQVCGTEVSNKSIKSHLENHSNPKPRKKRETPKNHVCADCSYRTSLAY